MWTSKLLTHELSKSNLNDPQQNALILFLNKTITLVLSKMMHLKPFPSPLRIQITFFELEVQGSVFSIICFKHHFCFSFESIQNQGVFAIMGILTNFTIKLSIYPYKGKISQKRVLGGNYFNIFFKDTLNSKICIYHQKDVLYYSEQCCNNRNIDKPNMMLIISRNGSKTLFNQTVRNKLNIFCLILVCLAVFLSYS